MRLNWIDDPQAESQLSGLGVSYVREDVQLAQIDVRMSLDNNARLDKPLCEDTVVEYACAMESKSRFPAIVLRKNGSGTYRVLSGNHRVGAVVFLSENGELAPEHATFDRSYVISTDDPMMIELVTRAANRWQGRRQGKSEALEHARWMMKKYSMDVSELAKHFCLTVKWLKERFKAEEIRASLTSQNIPTSNLTDQQIARIGQLAFNQRLQAKAATISQEYRLRAEDTKTLVDKIKQASQAGEQKGIEAAKEFEAAYRAIKMKVPEGTAAARRPVRGRFMTHLVGFHNFLKCGNKGREFVSLDEIQIAGSHDRHEAHEIWKQLKRKLDTLFHDAHNADRNSK